MKRLHILTLFLLLPFIISGCGPKPPVAQESIIAVEVMKATRVDMEETYNTSGVIKASQEVTIVPKVAGRVTAVHVKLGDQVQKGQVLFEIDSQTAANQAAQAEASYNTAKVGYDMAARSLQDIQTSYDRNKVLYENGAISKYEFEKVETALTNAQLGLEQARQAMEQARIAFNTAQQNLKDHWVTTPIDGLVGEINVEIGDMVSGQTSAAVIVNINTVKIEAPVSENVVNNITIGSKVTVNIDSLNLSAEGTVTAIAPKTDTKTMSYPVEISLDNASGMIKPGMSASLTLLTGIRKGVIAVPPDALLDQDGQKVVYVVENDTAKEVFVKVGAANDSQVEITEGLEEGQSIVVVGNHYLSDGQKVKVVGDNAEKANSAGSTSTGPEGNVTVGQEGDSK